MKISNQLLFDRGAQQMSAAQTKLAQLQAQLSQGKQVVNPSDAPDKAAAIQRINSVLSRQSSYQSACRTAPLPPGRRSSRCPTAPTPMRSWPRCSTWMANGCC